VVPTGGTKDYTYAWYKLPNTSAPESTNSKIENLSDDVYSIKVLDANGCPWTTPNLYNSYRPSPIEIKPTVHLYHKKNMAKFKAAQDFVLSGESNYSDYLILTENIIFIEPRKQDEIDESYIKYLISSYIDN
jgi:hypothetical protein